MKKTYVYDMNQANYFIGCGCRVIEVGINSNSKRAYIVFDREECTEAYYSWCKIKRAITQGETI